MLYRAKWKWVQLVVYVGSRVTSKAEFSMFSSYCFSRANGTCGMCIRPSLYIFAKKLSLTPTEPTTLTVTFKTSEGSSLNCHLISLGTWNKFFSFKVVLKVTLWVNGNELHLFTFVHICSHLFTQPTKDLSFASRKQLKTPRSKMCKKILLTSHYLRNQGLQVW